MLLIESVLVSNVFKERSSYANVLREISKRYVGIDKPSFKVDELMEWGK